MKKPSQPFVSVVDKRFKVSHKTCVCVCVGASKSCFCLAVGRVSSLRGSATRGAADIDGSALVVARRWKERTCPELVGAPAQCLSGGLSRCNYWKVVARDTGVPSLLESSHESKNCADEAQDRTGLETSLVVFAVVCRRECVRCFFPGCHCKGCPSLA